MESDYGDDLSGNACFDDWAALVRGAPKLPVRTSKYVLGSRFVARPLREGRLTFVGQNDVAYFSLAQAYCDRAAIGIEVAASQSAQLRIAAPSEESGLNQLSEIIRAGTNQTFGFVDGEITNDGFVDALERLDLAPCNV